MRISAARISAARSSELDPCSAVASLVAGGAGHFGCVVVFGYVGRSRGRGVAVGWCAWAVVLGGDGGKACRSRLCGGGCNAASSAMWGLVGGVLGVLPASAAAAAFWTA